MILVVSLKGVVHF